MYFSSISFRSSFVFHGSFRFPLLASPSVGSVVWPFVLEPFPFPLPFALGVPPFWDSPTELDALGPLPACWVDAGDPSPPLDLRCAVPLPAPSALFPSRKVEHPALFALPFWFFLVAAEHRERVLREEAHHEFFGQLLAHSFPAGEWPSHLPSFLRPFGSLPFAASHAAPHAAEKSKEQGAPSVADSETGAGPCAKLDPHPRTIAVIESAEAGKGRPPYGQAEG
jgi:hypothetical protein